MGIDRARKLETGNTPVLTGCADYPDLQNCYHRQHLRLTDAAHIHRELRRRYHRWSSLPLQRHESDKVPAGSSCATTSLACHSFHQVCGREEQHLSRIESEREHLRGGVTALFQSIAIAGSEELLEPCFGM